VPCSCVYCVGRVETTRQISAFRLGKAKLTPPIGPRSPLSEESETHLSHGQLHLINLYTLGMMAGNNNFRSVTLDGLEAAILVYNPALDPKAPRG